MIKNHRINVVATSLWGVRIFGVARFRRRIAPWLQRLRVHENASGKFISVLIAIAITDTGATIFAQGGAKPANVGDGTLTIKEKIIR
jgi:hypothetical protein